MAWLRAVALGCWGVQGRVDFRTLIWLGNLGLIALAAILVAGLCRRGESPSLLALVPLALLSPIQGKQMIWAMAAVSNYWALAFSAGALLLLCRGTRRTFGWASLLGAVAIFTSGQGLFCFAAGLVVLAIGRRWRQALVWLGIMAISAALYFHHYVRPAYHPAPEVSWTALQFFFAVVGGSLSELVCRILEPLLTEPHLEAALVPTIQAATGVLLVGLTGWLWIKRYYQRSLFVSVFLLYLLLLCAAVSVSRSGFGVQQALMPHYKVISASISVLVAVGLLDARQGNQLKPAAEAVALLGGTLFCLSSWCVCYPGVRAFSEQMAEARNWFVQRQDGRGVMSMALREQALDILWHSYLTGLLQLEGLNGGHPVRLSFARLTRIAVPCSQSLAVSQTAGAKEVARLLCAGGDLLVIPAHRSPETTDFAGSLLLYGGDLRYRLRARFATAPNNPRARPGG